MNGDQPMIVGEGPGADLAVIDDLDEIVEFVRRLPALFIRYSEGPDRDREGPSTDYESELVLPGLSVTSLSPPPWWTRPIREWVARRICKYANLMRAARRPRPWLLVGSEVGLGPDHEPLVAEAVPVAWVGAVALAQADRVYRDRFIVGRDSRCLPPRPETKHARHPVSHGPEVGEQIHFPEPWSGPWSDGHGIGGAAPDAQPSQDAARDSRCPFCFPAAIAPNQLLATTEHFYLLAPVGQIVEGFLAIMTHTCGDAPVRLRCLDDIPASWGSEINALRNIIAGFYREIYRAPALFYEHGRGGGHHSSLPGGDFVFHPHLCALPGDLQIHEPLQARLNYRRAQQFPSARTQIGRRPYIYVHTPDGRRHREPLLYYGADDGRDEHVARLSVKTLLAEVNSLEKDSAWRRYPGERELADLVERFNLWYATRFRRPSDPQLSTIVAHRPFW